MAGETPIDLDFWDRFSGAFVWMADALSSLNGIITLLIDLIAILYAMFARGGDDNKDADYKRLLTGAQ